MHASSLGIERRAEPWGDVVTLRGDLDLTNADQLADALDATHTRAVVLDLSAVAFVDSAGIRTIDGIRRRIEDGNRALFIVAPAESRAGWTFRVAGIADGVVLESLDAAMSLAEPADDA